MFSSLCLEISPEIFFLAHRIVLTLHYLASKNFTLFFLSLSSSFGLLHAVFEHTWYDFNSFKFHVACYGFGYSIFGYCFVCIEQCVYYWYFMGCCRNSTKVLLGLGFFYSFYWQIFWLVWPALTPLVMYFYLSIFIFDNYFCSEVCFTSLINK